MHKEMCALHYKGSIVFPSLSTGAGMTGNATSASAATPIVTGKARVTPTVNASGTSAAGAALEGGATAAAAAGAAAGGRAETGEVRKVHAGISRAGAGANVGRELLKADRRAGCNCCQPYLQGILRREQCGQLCIPIQRELITWAGTGLTAFKV